MVISLFEMKEIEPVKPGRSYFAIGRQPIPVPGHKNTILHYGDFSATIALYRQTADTVYTL
jgi:hypothetical protein